MGANAGPLSWGGLIMMVTVRWSRDKGAVSGLFGASRWVDGQLNRRCLDCAEIVVPRTRASVSMIVMVPEESARLLRFSVVAHCDAIAAFEAV
jgi:hypothetical protein